jgi:hypothetical protein
MDNEKMTKNIFCKMVKGMTPDQFNGAYNEALSKGKPGIAMEMLKAREGVD